MARSTSSQHRAQLVREMSKDMNNLRVPSRYSQGFTMTDFNPENESTISSRLEIRTPPHRHHQLEAPQNLPQLRASAEKYGRSLSPRPASPKSEYSYAKTDEYDINTSAIARAFPDFSQGSDEPADVTHISGCINDHQGTRKGSGDAIAQLKRTRGYSAYEEKDTADLSIPSIQSSGGTKYQVMYTPPLRQRNTSNKTDGSPRASMRRDAQVRQASELQKQINDPSPPPVKTKDSGSEGSRKASGEARRTLASMHARVKDENDKSLINEGRPPTIDVTARNTRFANTTGQQVNATAQEATSRESLPTRFSSAQTLLGSAAPKNKRNTQGVPSFTQGTQQTFKQPTIPNLTELVTGVFEDGTPVFSLDGMPRSSRFAAALQQNTHHNGAKPTVEEVDLPIDEHAIFLNIKLLQDKVAILERHNAEAAVAIDELKAKNYVLEGEKAMRQRQSRSDSALGTDSDDGNDTVISNRKILIEKNRLQSSVYALEARLDASNRKGATAETILKNITQERDSAVSQLGVAYFTIEQLKGENEGVREENEDLKARISQLTTNYESETPKNNYLEDRIGKQTTNHQDEAQKLNDLKARIGQVTTNYQSETQKNNDLRARISKLTTNFESETQKNNELRAQLSQIAVNYENETQRWTAKEEAMQRNLEEVKNMVAKFSQRPSGRGNQSVPAAPFQAPVEDQELNVGQAKASTDKDVDTLFDFSGTPHAANAMSKNVQQTTQMETSQASHNAANEVSKSKRKASAEQSLRANSTQTNGTSMDLTYLSYIDTNDVSDLRKAIEQERIERKQRQQLKCQPSKGDSTFTQTGPVEVQPQHSQTTLPRKSSTEDMRARSLPKEPTEQSLHPTEPTEHSRRHSETSLLSIRRRRRCMDTENMTSAFIMPDITMANPIADTQEIPTVSKDAQKVLNGLANHSGHNCTVCKRIVKAGEDHDHAETVKETIKISKPVPVSERILETTDNEDDHTIRPSQPPALALATVVKGLEDELDHLKIQFSKYRELYNGHNPALSKRSRKSVQQKIERLLQAMDAKSDQIYALYDVLEGQKKDGHEFSEDEVEITLQSIGVDVASLRLRGGEVEMQPEGYKQKPRTERNPWDLESEGESEELPWEGIDSTVETMKSGFSKAGRRRT